MLKQKSSQHSLAYDKIAGQISMPQDFYLNIVRAIGSLHRREKVLDIGCGNGYLLEKIAFSNPQTKLVGLDFSQKMVKNAQKRLQKAEVVVGNALALPFQSNEFELVILSEVLEHLQNPLQGIAEAKRVLKTSGRFLLTFPNSSSYRPFYPLFKKLPRGKLRNIFTPPEDPEKSGQPIDRGYFFDEVISLLKKAKFKIEKISGTIFFPYIGQLPIASSFVIFLWRKTPFDKILNKLIGPRWAYRVLIKAVPIKKRGRFFT